MKVRTVFMLNNRKCEPAFTFITPSELPFLSFNKVSVKHYIPVLILIHVLYSIHRFLYVDTIGCLSLVRLHFLELYLLLVASSLTYLYTCISLVLLYLICLAVPHIDSHINTPLKLIYYFVCLFSLFMVY